jgi:hypothetical protein
VQAPRIFHHTFDLPSEAINQEVANDVPWEADKVDDEVAESDCFKRAVVTVVVAKPNVREHLAREQTLAVVGCTKTLAKERHKSAVTRRITHSDAAQHTNVKDEPASTALIRAMRNSQGQVKVEECAVETYCRIERASKSKTLPYSRSTQKRKPPLPQRAQSAPQTVSARGGNNFRGFCDGIIDRSA